MTLVNRLFSFEADYGIFFLNLYNLELLISVIAPGQLQRVFIARSLPVYCLVLAQRQ